MGNYIQVFRLHSIWNTGQQGEIKAEDEEAESYARSHSEDEEIRLTTTMPSLYLIIACVLVLRSMCRRRKSYSSLIDGVR